MAKVPTISFLELTSATVWPALSELACPFVDGEEMGMVQANFLPPSNTTSSSSTRSNVARSIDRQWTEAAIAKR